MHVYQSKFSRISGSSSKDVVPVARKHYRDICRQSKRQPYVRSRYFNGNKVFLNTFWPHLLQKRRSDQVRRLKFFNCAVDLIRNSPFEPLIILEKQSTTVILYRFSGVSRGGQSFYVQIACHKKTGRKDFMSVFPE